MVLRKLAPSPSTRPRAALVQGAPGGTGRTLGPPPDRGGHLSGLRVVDETPQANDPTRSGSVRDFLVDVSGAAVS